MLALEYHKLFSYNPETGILVRKIKTSNRTPVGTIAGSRKENHKGKPYSRNYLQTRVLGKIQYVHRIIYVMMTGENVPFGKEIDHINGDGTDNRWVNLRLATKSQNMGNRTSNRKRIRDLPKGVNYHKRDRLYGAKLAGRNLGYFKKIEDAKRAYDEYSEQYYGEFHRS